MKAIVSSFVCLLFVGFTVAQTPSPKPAPEMEKLLKMWVGHWTTVEIFEPSEDMPKGKQDKGAETMRPGPGGLSLIGDYESHGAPFGHMVVTWIPSEKVYKSYWTDSSQPGVSVSTGKWEGEKLVFTSIDESNGKKILSRDTYSDITPTSFTDTLESGPLGGPMNKILTVKYTKHVEAAASEWQNVKPLPKQDADPCPNAMTQLELNQCAGNEYRKADAHLNAIYSKLMKLLRDDKEKEVLKRTEKAWIQYRNLHCEEVRPRDGEGSMAPMVWANCMTMLTADRVEEIKALYETPDLSLE